MHGRRREWRVVGLQAPRGCEEAVAGAAVGQPLRSNTGVMLG
jgi:hypothetical protein